MDGSARMAAVNVGKTARYMSRALGRGGGSTLPGFLAQRIYPGVVEDLSQQILQGCVLVTGTNGKTTTIRILADALHGSGFRVITNPEGSNLWRGIATALVIHANGWGKIGHSRGTIGVFEVDEGALHQVVAILSPRLIIVTNLFRDQLDRYFEVDFVAHLWSAALARLSPSTAVVLNADDPQVAYLREQIPGKGIAFDLDDAKWARFGLEHAADSRRCPRCHHDLAYEVSYFAHLGHYVCRECGWKPLDPLFVAKGVEIEGLKGVHFRISTPDGDRYFDTHLA